MGFAAHQTGRYTVSLAEKTDSQFPVKTPVLFKNRSDGTICCSQVVVDMADTDFIQIVDNANSHLPPEHPGQVIFAVSQYCGDILYLYPAVIV